MHEHIESEELDLNNRTEPPMVDQRIIMESGSGEANVLQPMKTSKILLDMVDNVKKTWSKREDDINGNGNSIENFLKKIESRYSLGPIKEEPKNLPPAPLLLFRHKKSPKVANQFEVNTICSPKNYPVKTSQPGPSHSPNSPMYVEYSLKPQMRLYPQSPTYNNPFCVTAYNINNNRELGYFPQLILTNNVPLVLSPGQTPRPNPTSPYDVYPCRVILTNNVPLVLVPGQTPRPNPNSPQIQSFQASNSLRNLI
jgi:hypothetical protein